MTCQNDIFFIFVVNIKAHLRFIKKIFRNIRTMWGHEEDLADSKIFLFVPYVVLVLS
jgi:hypothetical protein